MNYAASILEATEQEWLQRDQQAERNFSQMVEFLINYKSTTEQFAQ